MKSPNYKHTKKTIKAIREYICRHMHVKEVKIGQHLNLYVWKNGRKNPPPKIKVKSMMENDYAKVELPEFPFEQKAPEEGKKSLKEKILGKKDEEKEEKAKKKEALEELEKEEQEKARKEHITEKPEPGTPGKAVGIKEENIEKIRKEKIVTRSKKKGRHEPSRV